MRHVDERDPDLLLDRLELDLKRFAELRVEGAQRLVEQAGPRGSGSAPGRGRPAAAGRRRAGSACASRSRSDGRARARDRPSRRSPPSTSPCSGGRRRRSSRRSGGGRARSSGRRCSRGACAAARSATSVPSRTTCPSVGRSNPAIIRSVVVLPQPDGPRSEKNSPGATFRLMPSTAVKSPKRFTRSTSCTSPPAMRRRVYRGHEAACPDEFRGGAGARPPVIIRSMERSKRVAVKRLAGGAFAAVAGSRVVLLVARRGRPLRSFPTDDEAADPGRARFRARAATPRMHGRAHAGRGARPVSGRRRRGTGRVRLGPRHVGGPVDRACVGALRAGGLPPERQGRARVGCAGERSEQSRVHRRDDLDPRRGS